MPGTGESKIGPARSVPADVLSEASRAAVRAVAVAGRASGEVAEQTAAVVVADALGRSVTVETMIIAVKREWSVLDEVRQIGSAADARAMLDRLVSRCIDAFYARR